ncbi:VanW family protein [Heyndrickxia acidiproducens]|uniref:VanW family protein n=1 Tax=Heyndrickxia acidiproducens TaxID=1121084 RepID=UPI000368D6F1|nr:VanW family protein [Heyndrickxia acidiproducens]
MGNNRFVKVFIVLFTSTAFILGFSHFGVLALEKGFGHAAQLSNGTSAGGVSLSGMEKDKAGQKLENAVQNWKSSHPIMITYLNHSAKLPADRLQFDIKETLKHIRDGGSTPLFVTLNNRVLMNVLSKAFPAISLEDWNIDRLNADICKAAARLETGKTSFDLSAYTLSDQTEKVVSKATLTSIPAADRYELETWVKEFPKLNIPAASSFSLLKTAGETGSYFSNTALSIVASAIYEAVLPTNFECIERYTSSELPGYATPGKEARVVQDKLDFAFINPNHSAYTLQFAYKNGALTVSVTGRPFAEKYKIISKNAQTIEPKTAVHYTSTLTAKQSVVLQYGKTGHYVKIYRNVYSRHNSLLKSVPVSEDFYPAVSEIIAKGYPEEDNSGAEDETDANASGDSKTSGNASSTDQNRSTESNESTADGQTGAAQPGSSAGKNAPSNSKDSNDNSRTANSGSTNNES